MKNLIFAIAICMMAMFASCNSNNINNSNNSNNNGQEPYNVECYRISWEVSSDVDNDGAIIKIYQGEELVDCVSYNYGYYIAIGPVDEYRLEKETNHGIDTLLYTCEYYGILADAGMIVLWEDIIEATPYDSVRYYIVATWSTGEIDSIIEIRDPGKYSATYVVNVVEYYHDDSTNIYTRQYITDLEEFFKNW